MIFKALCINPTVTQAIIPVTMAASHISPKPGSVRQPFIRMLVGFVHWGLSAGQGEAGQGEVQRLIFLGLMLASAEEPLHGASPCDPAFTQQGFPERVWKGVGGRER